MKQIQKSKKAGISLAWDNLGLFVLATIVLIVIIFLILKFGKTGSGFIDTLGNIF